MTASKEDTLITPAILGAFDQNIAEAELGREIAQQRILRLLGSTFVNTGRAERGLRHCLGRYGVERTIQMLDDEGVFGRTFYFGAFRGGLGWFVGHISLKVYEALHELPEAIRDHALIDRKIADLVQARQQLQQRAMARPAPTPAIERDTGRKRTR